MRIALLLTGLPVAAVLAAGLPMIPRLDFQRALWQPPQDYGVLGVFLGTLLAAGIGCAAAIYLGYGCGVQMAFNRRGARAVGLLSATPAVLLGAALAGPLRPILLQVGLGEGILLAGLGLGLLGLPDAAYATRDSAHALRREFLAAQALGLRADDALGAVRPGIVRALARCAPQIFARLAGEATLVGLLIGNAGGWPAAVRPSGALSSVLLSEALQAPPASAWQGRLAAVAAIVLLLSLAAGIGRGGGRHAASR